MTHIAISDDLKGKLPELKLFCIECDVMVAQEAGNLWKEIQEKIGELRVKLKVEQISKMPAIAASRAGYKVCGKDPARYRLSAEALLRRIIQGKDLYRVNNVVDLLNLVSISTGYSIGGYDADRIDGDVVFGTGCKDEPYEGIGRGNLNIDMMPVFRDSKGAFGSPTSDSVRTAVTTATQRFLMVIVGFNSGNSLVDASKLAINYLKSYAGAKNIESYMAE